MEFVPLHYKLDYLNDCAEVLNEEWPRSKTARIHSLEKSCDSLPTCLILLDEHRNLIGHSRLSDMRGMDGACLVESVVVRRRERGKGYGREVMAATERYAKRNGFKWMYLTTHDKQKFYEKLGYQYCDPVVSFGGDFSNLPESFTRALAGLSGRDRGDITRSSKAAEQTQQHCQQMDDQTKTPGGNCVKTNANHCLVNAAPAPTSPFTETQTSGTLPPPTAPPPPPPPIPQSAGSKQKVAVVRWDPSKVSWMRKQLESN